MTTTRTTVTESPIMTWAQLNEAKDAAHALYNRIEKAAHATYLATLDPAVRGTRDDLALVVYDETTGEAIEERNTIIRTLTRAYHEANPHVSTVGGY